MKTKHTPEPWHIGRAGCVVSESHVGLTINGATGEDAIRYYGGNLIGESISNANTARIVACVNACAGMEDPAAEIAALRERIAELEAKSPTKPQPNWDLAPDWAKWWAVDEDGSSYWYEEVPLLCVDFWDNQMFTKWKTGDDHGFTNNWRETLTKRP